MKSILIYLLLLSSVTATAQQVVIDTTWFIGTDNQCVVETKYAIATKDNGILLVGETDCWTGSDEIPPSPPDSAGDAGNLVIIKLDSNMHFSWAKVYGGYRLDIGMSACQTPDGGYAVLGTTQSYNRDVSGNHGSQDFWLVRIDASGNLLWAKCYGGPGADDAASVALTKDNGFIMLGGTNGSGGDVPFIFSSSGFTDDWLVIKTDSLGNKQWSNTLGGTGDEIPSGTILVVDTGYYLVGSSNSENYDCTDTSWHPGITNTSYDYYILKLDDTGHMVWNKSFGGSGADDVNRATWDSRDSSILINGLTESNNYMVTGFHGQDDMWAIKTDRNGILKWETCLGTAGEEQGTSIILLKLILIWL